MKKFLLSLSIVMPLLSFSQWDLTFKTRSYNAYNSLEVVNNSIYVVDSDSALVKRSPDEGNTWFSHQTAFTSNWFGDWLLDIDFPTPLVGYICGGTAFGFHKSSLLKTLDGGITWDSVTANYYNYEFTHMEFINADTGFISMDYGLMRTFDGGDSLEEVTIPNLTGVTDIIFIDNSTGFIATRFMVSSGNYKYTILRTEDFGDNWVEVYSDQMSNVTGLNHRVINDIYFVDNNIGYAVGGDGTFLKTIDSGLNWTSSNINAVDDLSTVHFINEDVGYTNMNRGISKTIDGGLTWEAQTLSDSSNIFQIIFANDSVGYAIGDSGVYKIIESSIIDNISSDLSPSLISIYPNPSNGVFNLQFSDKINRIKVFDTYGREIMKTNNQTQIDLTNQEKGIYYVNIISGDNITVEKIVLK